ncbi:hypothetical protein VNO77_46360 [Canavalia gladiata]|uniref:Uncharacterized protein n=1 Tax=Canavalia gladiata TaxID=3824 RepID=A0AAN9JCG8_CANGL
MAWFGGTKNCSCSRPSIAFSIEMESPCADSRTSETATLPAAPANAIATSSFVCSFDTCPVELCSCFIFFLKQL